MGPVTLCYKERWGPAALFTSFTVSSHSRPTDITLIRSRGCAASDGKLHCLTATGLRHRTSSPRHRATAGTLLRPLHHPTPSGNITDVMDGSSSSTKPSDSQRPLPLSLLLHLDLVVQVLGFVHHAYSKMYPLDLRLRSCNISINGIKCLTRCRSSLSE